MSGTTLDLSGLNAVTLDPTQYGFAASVSRDAAAGTFTVSAAGNTDLTTSPGNNNLYTVKSGVPVSFKVTQHASTPSLFDLSLRQSNVALGGGNVGSPTVKVLGWNADSILLQNTTAYSALFRYIIISDVPLVGGTPNDQTFGTTAAAPFGLAVVCFAEGTRIATPSGPVAVQDLAEGALVCTLSGYAQPITWIGTASFDCAQHAQPARVTPVRIEAGAFGPAQPSRTLLVSPEHAVFAGGVLVPAHRLVNGATVRQLPAGSVTYYHIELPRHDVVLAEGLPAETYLDTGNRDALIRREARAVRAA